MISKIKGTEANLPPLFLSETSAHTKHVNQIFLTSPKFSFYNEPPHIHVATADGECKFWLDPVKLARNQNLSPKVIRQIEKLVFENSVFLYAKFNEYHVR